MSGTEFDGGKVLSDPIFGRNKVPDHIDGVDLIIAERKRQIAKEGWTAKHDDKHTDEALAMAAACYATPVPIRAKLTLPINCGCREAMCPHTMMTKTKWGDPWPWNSEWDKRGKHDRIKQLAIAGALIAAEIDRLLRAVQP